MDSNPGPDRPPPGRSHWTRRPVVRLDTHARIARASVVFTWQLPEIYLRAVQLQRAGYQVIAGGPAVRLLPGYLAPVATEPTFGIGADWPDALHLHNPNATFTTRGCPRGCSFCAVQQIDGPFRELHDWPDGTDISDPNLLASSRAHFDRVIDWLKAAHPDDAIDFNQGLDARLLTQNHADRLAELNRRTHIRLAFDHISQEIPVAAALARLRRAGINTKTVSIYVMIGYRDTPADAEYRLRLVRDTWHCRPFPMRYHPLDTLRRNDHVDPNWTEWQLRRFISYWSRLNHTAPIPFEIYRHHNQPEPEKN